MEPFQMTSAAWLALGGLGLLAWAVVRARRWLAQRLRGAPPRPEPSPPRRRPRRCSTASSCAWRRSSRPGRADRPDRGPGVRRRRRAAAAGDGRADPRAGARQERQPRRGAGRARPAARPDAGARADGRRGRGAGAVRAAGRPPRCAGGGPGPPRAEPLRGDLGAADAALRAEGRDGGDGVRAARARWRRSSRRSRASWRRGIRRRRWSGSPSGWRRRVRRRRPRWRRSARGSRRGSAAGCPLERCGESVRGDLGPADAALRAEGRDGGDGVRAPRARWRRSLRRSRASMAARDPQAALERFAERLEAARAAQETAEAALGARVEGRLESLQAPGVRAGEGGEPVRGDLRIS